VPAGHLPPWNDAGRDRPKVTHCDMFLRREPPADTGTLRASTTVNTRAACPRPTVMQPLSLESPLMQTDTPAAVANVSDDAVVSRLFDLARQGDTATREFQLLDFVIQKRLLQTYGGEIIRSAA
jgi:hypothetical protein